MYVPLPSLRHDTCTCTRTQKRGESLFTLKRLYMPIRLGSVNGSKAAVDIPEPTRKGSKRELADAAVVAWKCCRNMITT